MLDPRGRSAKAHHRLTGLGAFTTAAARRGGLGAERGAALIEFALVSLVLYLMLAGAVEFGRLMFGANVLQDAARVAARELALAPIRANVSFDFALTCSPLDDPANCLVDLRRRVFDPACLVVDYSDPAVSNDPEGYFAAMPMVNQVLRSLMITEPSRPELVRYPGALLSDDAGLACSAVGPNGAAGPTGLTVGIPLVTTSGGGGETITWVPVLEEIRPAQDDECPTRGPFSLVYLSAQDLCGPLPADPSPTRGVAAVRVNYPYQAAMLSAFHAAEPTVGDQFPPNLFNPVLADDGSLQETNSPPGGLIDDGGAVGPYAGPYGLGRQLALAGRVVRPFRRLVTAQAVQRREVFE
jgi:hypothetical protein